MSREVPITRPVAGQMWRQGWHYVRVDRVTDAEVYVVVFTRHSEYGVPLRVFKHHWTLEMANAKEVDVASAIADIATTSSEPNSHAHVQSHVSNLREMPEFVLRYFAPMQAMAEEREELHRRREAANQENNHGNSGK